MSINNNFGFPVVPTFDPRTAVHATGHRPNKLPGLYDPYAQGNVQMLLFLRKELEAMIEAGFVTFVSGGALGIDLWFARIVLALKSVNPQVKLYMYIPCLQQDKKWVKSSCLEYKSVLEQADGVRFVTEREYTPS